jgi:hypothetical protein
MNFSAGGSIGFRFGLGQASLPGKKPFQEAGIEKQ